MTTRVPRTGPWCESPTPQPETWSMPALIASAPWAWLRDLPSSRPSSTFRQPSEPARARLKSSPTAFRLSPSPLPLTSPIATTLKGAGIRNRIPALFFCFPRKSLGYGSIEPALDLLARNLTSTELPPRSATPARSLRDRWPPQTSSAAPFVHKSSTAGQTSCLLALLQTIPQFAWATQEFPGYLPAAQSQRETDLSFHPPYAVLQETPARCIRDPLPPPRKQNSAGTQPPAAAETDSAEKPPAPTACDHRLCGEGLSRKQACAALPMLLPQPPLPADSAAVPARPSGRNPHPRRPHDCRPPAAARSSLANSPVLRSAASPAKSWPASSTSNAPAIAPTSPATAAPIADSDTPRATASHRSASSPHPPP